MADSHKLTGKTSIQTEIAKWHQMVPSLALHVPYSEKLLGLESLVNLVNLANRPWFSKLKISTTINNLLGHLLIHLSSFCQKLAKSRFTNLYSCQTFPLYGKLNTPATWHDISLSFGDSLLAATCPKEPFKDHPCAAGCLTSHSKADWVAFSSSTWLNY